MRTFFTIAILLTAGWSSPLLAQSVEYRAVGDSLTAGFSSGGLSETQQLFSYPALINRQLNGEADTFNLPLFPEPGCGSDGPQLGLSLSPGPACSPTPVPKTFAGDQTGCMGFASLAPFDNLAVPGATLSQSLNTLSSENPFFGLILQGQGTMVDQAVAADPDLITVWLGNNDALGSVVAGANVEAFLTPAAVFAADYAELMDELAATGADIAVATIPDVTAIPFVSFIGPFAAPGVGFLAEVSDGAPRQLTAGEFVTVGALPIVQDPDFNPMVPLPDAVVIDAAEVATIRGRTAEFNATIRSEAARVGATVVDLASVLAEIAIEGFPVGGAEFTTAFITGGIFSFDGIHLTATGYAIAANEFIEGINEAFGRSIPLVNLGDFAFEGDGSPVPIPLSDFPQECLAVGLAPERFRTSATSYVTMVETLGPVPAVLLDIAELEANRPRPPRARNGRTRNGEVPAKRRGRR